jgi:hypothetical protein
VVKSWLEAEDNWQDWYRDDKEAIEKKHWFGNYEYSFKNRWGFITACMFGSQNGEGQYHKNCYTSKKLNKIFDKLNFSVVHEETFIWPRECKDDKIIRIIAEKN